MTGRLAGRTAFITGAGRGIGAAIAARFAAEGAALVLVARTSSELDVVAQRCLELGASGCVMQPADVARPEAVREAVRHALTLLGAIDVVVNAAGILGPVGLVAESEPVAWQRVIAINLMGAVNVCREVLPGMIAGGSGGSILNLSGGGATAPRPGFAAYAASKAALVRLTETLAEEMRPHGVRVNAIAPGTVDTRMLDEVLAAGARGGPDYDRIRAMRAAGAGFTAAEAVADLALFLASGASEGLTGRLVSAEHDDWQSWDRRRIEIIQDSAWYTLRRLDPHTIDGLSVLAE